jgi:NAD+ synthetase
MLTLALVQFQPVKGAYDANVRRLGGLLAACAGLDPRPDVVQLPETAPTGYFVEGGVRELAVTAGTMARDLDAAYRAACAEQGRPVAPLDVLVGFYEVWRSTLHNSAAYVTLGADTDPGWSITHVHRKVFLPTYGLFDEERFVERGTEFRAFDAPWGRAGVLVCEDAWHTLPGTILALDGAQVVFVSSAAPARGAWPRDDAVPGPASVARWERLVRDIAEEHGVFVAYANLVGSEGGKALSGSSTVCGPKGDVRVRAPVFDETIVSITLDLADLTRARADSPLLNDLRVALPHLLANVEAVQRAEREGGGPGAPRFDPPADAAATHELVRVDERDPRRATAVGAPAGEPRDVPAAEAPAEVGGVPLLRAGLRDHGLPPSLAIDPALVERWLVAFIREELARRGFRRGIVGLSGGVDSAGTTYLAVRALGPENVTVVRMPYRTSSAASLEHAQLVVDDLGIEARTVEITDAVDGYLRHEPEADGQRRGNVMARTRMIALFDLSARYRALPLGTGNKTERLFGYYTWHADDSPPINPLGDLYKTQVWALARHLGVPSAIVDKPPSADLVQGQTDEGDFGIPYAEADVILDWLLHGHHAEDLALRGFDPAKVAIVRRRLEGTHWKRRLPAVAMISPTAIGEAYLRPVDY